MKALILKFVVLVGLAASAQANLLRNPSFETVPGPVTGQGLMPSDWVTVNSSPDTYSNDGSYGLPPTGFGNFPGVTAQNGIRWVAGWSASQEDFGQTLSAALTPGMTYTLSGYLHQALRSDLDNPGGFQIYLTANQNYSSIASGTLLGSLGPTINDSAWEAASLTFTAPANAGTHMFLAFVPYAVNPNIGQGAYPGLDNLSLAALPEPSTYLAGALLTLVFGVQGVRSFRKHQQAA